LGVGHSEVGFGEHEGLRQEAHGAPVEDGAHEYRGDEKLEVEGEHDLLAGVCFDEVGGNKGGEEAHNDSQGRDQERVIVATLSNQLAGGSRNNESSAS